MQYDKAVNYLKNLNSQKNRLEAAQRIFLYCEYAKCNPDELLLKKSGFGETEAERLLDGFRNLEEYPESLKWVTISSIRGFYRVNYRDLAKQAGKMEYNVKKTYTLLNVEQKCRLYKAAYTPRDHAIIMLALTTAIANDSFTHLHWSHFEPEWTKQDIPHISLPPTALKGHGKGKYRNVRQETFITPEAKTVILEYRDWFSKTFEYVWKPDDPVFMAIKGGVDPMVDFGRTVMRISDRSEVKFSIHDGRRIVQTALESHSCPNNWIKKIKGRKCSGEEAPYSRPAIEKLREAYQRALPDLEFLGTGYGKANERSAEDEEIISNIIAAVKAGKMKFTP